MVDQPLVGQGKLGSGNKPLLPGVHIPVQGQRPVGLILQDPGHQGGDIVKMVVECVAVDAAVLHNVLDRDLVKGLCVQQLDEGIHNCLFGK